MLGSRIGDALGGYIEDAANMEPVQESSVVGGREVGVAAEPYRTGNGNVVVEKGTQDVLGAAATHFKIQVGHFGRALDAGQTLDGTDNADSGRPGLGFDVVNGDIAILPIDGALDRCEHAYGLAAVHGKVGCKGVCLGLKRTQGTPEAAGRRERACDVAHVVEVDLGKSELA